MGKKAEIIAGSQRTMLGYLRTTGVSFLNISTIYLFWGPARSHLMSALWLRWKSVCKDLLNVTKTELAYISIHVQWHLGNHHCHKMVWIPEIQINSKSVELLKNGPVRLIKIKCHRSPVVEKMFSDHFCT